MSLGLVDLQQVSVTLDDVLDDGGVVHGAQVSQTLGVSLHHLPQHPPHYLPRARLRQALDKLPEDHSKAFHMYVIRFGIGCPR